MEFKTLVIFDTNCLRKTSGDRVTYSEFGFGGNYWELKEFISRNNLKRLITLAVPCVVIEELTMQSKRDYFFDVEDIKSIQNRFGKFGKISVHQEPDFDIDTRLEKEVGEFLASDAELTVLEMKKDNDILDHLKRKAFLNSLPFKNKGNSGFKDALLWANILHADVYEKYDRVYFLTENVRDFVGCEKEFLKKHGKEFEVVPYQHLEVLLGNMYEEKVEDAPIYALVKSEYFETYLKENLQGMMFIETDQSGRPIESKILKIDIVDVLYDLKERDEIDDDGNPISFQDVTSVVNVFFDNGELKECLVKSVIGADNQLLGVELSR